MKKLIQLKANDWPKIQEQLKKLHLTKFYQATAQQQVGNGARSNGVVQTKIHDDLPLQYELLPKEQNFKQKSHYISHQSVHQNALKAD